MMKSEHPPGAKDFFPFVSLSWAERDSSALLANWLNSAVSLLRYESITNGKENFDEKSFHRRQMRQSKVELAAAALSLGSSSGCYLTKSFHTAILKLLERRFYFILFFCLNVVQGWRVCAVELSKQSAIVRKR
jgi:hypothetical protein